MLLLFMFGCDTLLSSLFHRFALYRDSHWESFSSWIQTDVIVLLWLQTDVFIEFTYFANINNKALRLPATVAVATTFCCRVFFIIVFILVNFTVCRMQQSIYPILGSIQHRLEVCLARTYRLQCELPRIRGALFWYYFYLVRWICYGSLDACYVCVAMPKQGLNNNDWNGVSTRCRRAHCFHTL